MSDGLGILCLEFLNYPGLLSVEPCPPAGSLVILSEVRHAFAMKSSQDPTTCHAVCVRRNTAWLRGLLGWNAALLVFAKALLSVSAQRMGHLFWNLLALGFFCPEALHSVSAMPLTVPSVPSTLGLLTSLKLSTPTQVEKTRVEEFLP